MSEGKKEKKQLPLKPGIFFLMILMKNLISWDRNAKSAARIFSLHG